MNPSPFVSTLRPLGGGHGSPPVVFLTDLVAWARQAPDELFAPNDVAVDIFTAIKSKLATPAGTDGAGTPIFHWDSLLHRKAAFCEAARIHAGRESDWQDQEGVDRTNARSQADIKGQEAGLFQVSFDAVFLPHGRKEALWDYAVAHGIETPEKFIHAMKFHVTERSEEERRIVFDFYAHLMRQSIAWAGPFLRHNADSVYPYLSRAALQEFMGMLG